MAVEDAAEGGQRKDGECRGKNGLTMSAVQLGGQASQGHEVLGSASRPISGAVFDILIYLVTDGLAPRWFCQVCERGYCGAMTLAKWVTK